MMEANEKRARKIDAVFLALKRQGLSYREIGKRHGVTGQRARQRVLKAARLKHKEVERKKLFEKFKKDKFDLPLDAIDFSVRTANCLANSNLRTLGELIALPAHRLLRIKNFGRKSLKEVQEILNDYGFELSERHQIVKLGDTPGTVHIRLVTGDVVETHHTNCLATTKKGAQIIEAARKAVEDEAAKVRQSRLDEELPAKRRATSDRIFPGVWLRFLRSSTVLLEAGLNANLTHNEKADLGHMRVSVDDSGSVVIGWSNER